MKNRWTEDQKKAIEARDCSLIVSAAAGSGKTSVLVERLLRIISDSENRVPVEKMIVATFTNDAAAEMKRRLSDAISKLILENPSDRWLSRQYSMLPGASISTIHSFCFDLIRNNAAMLSISGVFRIIDDMEEKLIRNEVLGNLIGEYYEKKPELMGFLTDNFCSGSSDKPLESLLPNIYKDISSIPFFRLWMKDALEKYDSETYREYYIGYLKERFSECGELLELMRKKAEHTQNTKLISLYEDHKAVFDAVKRAVMSPEKSPFPKLKFMSFPRFTKAENESLSLDDIEAIKNIKAMFIDSLKDFSYTAYEVMSNEKADLLLHKRTAAALFEFISDYDKALMERKSDMNAIGFDDAEQLALGLLAYCDEEGNVSKSELANELSDYYALIMIDEFQDSNNRQDMIFRLLSRNGDAEKYGDNLFFVGDVKQSIYRFRLANPDNFINAMERALPYKKDSKNFSSIQLNKNFRSSAEVIEFVNFMFSHLMRWETGEIDYNEDEFLVKGAEFCPSDRNTEVIMYDRKNLPENAEAAIIADKIYEMLESGYPVSADGGKSSRPCEMRDFCILKRKKDTNDLFVKELEKRGLSAECEETAGYLKSREISVLINLLKAVDNPLNDTALVSVMMSPMFALNADDVTKIRLIDKKGYIYNNMVKGLGTDDIQPLFDSELLAKARFIYRSIAELRLYSAVCTVRELVQRIYDSTDFLSVMQLYKDSEKKKANLRLLMEYAESYEKNSNGGLSGFVKYIDRITENGKDFESASASASSRNAVSVKTMHKSKGLEFPFVFIVESHREFHRQKRSDPYYFSDKMGLGFLGQNRERYERFETLPYEAIKIFGRRAMAAEEMRLLYVALTRAKEKLFFTLDVSDSAAKKAAVMAESMRSAEGLTNNMIMNVKSMGEWIMMMLLALDKNAPLKELLGIYESFSYGGNCNVNFWEYDEYREFEEFRETDEEKREDASEKLVRELEEILEKDYSMRLSDLTAKLSVSDISKDSDTFSVPLKKPKLSQEKRGLTGAQRGTALHRFLQFADFESLENSIKSEVDRLCDTGYITAAERESIKTEDVQAFLDSKLYERIKNSKEILRERKFLVSIDDLELDDELGHDYKNTDGMLNGIIDMIIVEDNSIVLVDYKTDRVSDAKILAEKYRSQLMLYKKALDKIYPLPVSEAIIYSFYKKTEIRVF